ncbi:hypothetical protein [Tellurirhabdus bombi]|uniref:hypothetical protein n=1 Tax=Tellurirhabdus bombi TaxID=2907205 RepID=UPI001F35AEB7|nr:hypothetical protein [Tellurirhabdus bombi]
MKKSLLLLLFLGGLLMGCFRPAISLNTQPNYPVDVFYANQTRPEAHYTDLKWLEFTEETPLTDKQRPKRGGRLLSKGTNQEQKEILLAKLTLEAKKIGADALMDVRYQYYISADVNGYKLGGMAIKYTSVPQ